MRACELIAPVDNCWDRFAQVLLSVFSFQSCKDTVCLPHLYYIFNQHPIYSTYRWDDWCKIEIADLVQIYGPTSMYSLKATSFLVMIQTIKELKDANRLHRIPDIKEFYCEFAQCNEKSADLGVTAEFGHHRCIGIPNDVHMSVFARANKYFKEAKQALNLKDEDSSPEITRLLEIVFDRKHWLNVNEVIGSAIMTERMSIKFNPFIDFILSLPTEKQQSEYAYDFSRTAYIGVPTILDTLLPRIEETQIVGTICPMLMTDRGRRLGKRNKS